MSMTIILAASIGLLTACSSCEELRPQFERPRVADEGEHWGVRYILDHCKRCPDCCTTTDGFIDEYGVWRPDSWLPPDPVARCIESNAGKLRQGWTEAMLHSWCVSSIKGDD